ncbi:MAG: ribonuclease III [Oscillospiraceae bacterium]|nr:ribonuclease III [Oscillospiraceae bacterium]
MTNLLQPGIPINKLHGISILALAHIGDGVYELMVRTRLCLNGTPTAKLLHTATVKQVNATRQAVAARALQQHFTQEEIDVFRRGRNAKSPTMPKNIAPEDYKLATALEAVFGHLYLTGNTARLNALMDIIGGLEN